jgi:serine protease Do
MDVKSRGNGEEMMRRTGNVILLALLIVTEAMAFPTASGTAPLTPTITPIQSLPAFADLVEKLSPAVVNIATTQKVSSKRIFRMPGLPNIPRGSNAPFEDFYDFFERFGFPNPEEDEGVEMRKATSLGSGFIIDPSGFVVTNNHVIANAEEITVVFSDETSMVAKIVGKDVKTDLALLKVESKAPLPFVSFGDSDQARVGEWVIAIGNPFGLGGTVTAGIISALARDIHQGYLDNYLQTDAAINTGNSGGPMFNIRGEVIGINTAIYSPSGGSVGVGFAIPSATAIPVFDQLKKTGKVRRSTLGVTIQDLTSEMAESIGFEKGKGVLVAGVNSNSPAAKGGIQANDIIVKFDNQEVTGRRKLPRLVAETPVGKKVPVELFRQGKITSVNVTLDEQKDDEEATPASKKDSPEPSSASEATLLGMELVPLDHELQQKLELQSKMQGLVVVTVARGSPAHKRGIHRGDIVTAINQQPIKKLEQCRDILRQAQKQGRKHILLSIYRRGETVAITLPID